MAEFPNGPPNVPLANEPSSPANPEVLVDTPVCLTSVLAYHSHKPMTPSSFAQIYLASTMYKDHPCLCVACRTWSHEFRQIAAAWRE